MADEIVQDGGLDRQRGGDDDRQAHHVREREQDRQLHCRAGGSDDVEGHPPPAELASRRLLLHGFRDS